MATIILLIRAGTDLKCFFTWQEQWVFAVRLSYPGVQPWPCPLGSDGIG